MSRFSHFGPHLWVHLIMIEVQIESFYEVLVLSRHQIHVIFYIKIVKNIEGFVMEDHRKYHFSILKIKRCAHTGCPRIKVTALSRYCKPHTQCTILIYTSNERRDLDFFRNIFNFIIGLKTKKLWAKALKFSFMNMHGNQHFWVLFVAIDIGFIRTIKLSATLMQFILQNNLEIIFWSCIKH